MPGLRQFFDAVRYKGTVAAGTLSASPAGFFEASCESKEYTSPVSLGVTSFKVGLGVYKNDGLVHTSDENEYTLSIPRLSVNNTYTATYDETFDWTLTFNDVSVYADFDAIFGYVFSVEIGLIEFIVNGITHYSVNHSGTVYKGNILSPAGIPILGASPAFSVYSATAPPLIDPAILGGTLNSADTQVHPWTDQLLGRVTGTAHVIEEQITTPSRYSIPVATRYAWEQSTGGPGTYDVTNSGTMSACGVEYDIGVTTYTPPATLAPFSWLNSGCGVTVAAPSISLTDTADLSISASHRQYSTTGSVYGIEQNHAQVMIVPDHQGEVIRMDPDDYSTVMLRFTLPEFIMRVNSVCDQYGSSPQTDIYEETLSPIASWTGGTSGRVNKLVSAVAQGTYINTWANPYWHYVHWFEDWEVNSVAADPDDYWTKIGQQKEYNAALPPADNLDRRVDLVSHETGYGPMPDEIDQFYLGHKSLWWGVEKFETLSVTWTASVQVDQNSPWTFTNAVVADAGTSMNISASVPANPVILELDLRSWTTNPYNYAAIAQRMLLQWSGSGISSATVELLNEYGDAVTIATATSATPHYRPQADDSKFMGSWEQDYDVGYSGGPFAGADTDAAGISSDVHTNGAREIHFALLFGRGAYRLKYTFNTDGSSFNVVHPTFYRSEDPIGIWQETAGVQMMAVPDGPSMRFGQVHHVSGGVVSATPVVFGIGARSFVLDAYMQQKTMFEGVAGVSAITAMRTADWDSYEFPTDLSLGSNSYGWIAPYGDYGTWVLQASYAYTPPVAALPQLIRSTTDLTKTTTMGVRMFSHCVVKRNYLSPSGYDMLQPTTNELWLTKTVPNPISGWQHWYHAKPTTDDAPEDDDMRIIVPGGQIATVPAWHGYLLIHTLAAVLEYPTNHSWSPTHYYRATAADNNIEFWSARIGSPEWGWDVYDQVTATGKDAYPTIATDPLRHCVLLAWEREDPAGTFDCRLVESFDEGVSWSSEVSIGAWRYPRVAASDHCILYLGFKYNSGSSGPGKIFVRQRYLGESALSTEAAIEDATADITFADELFDITPSKAPGVPWILVGKKDGSSDVSEFHSFDDGITWEEI